ncbi:hypothetical protein ACET34_25740 [Pseudomonas aeruginosa]
MSWFLWAAGVERVCDRARAELAWRRPGVEPIATPALAVAPRE